ncbi:MAG: high frequency lysogenization protein HflD [Gammaproteobacteria bacterium]
MSANTAIRNRTIALAGLFQCVHLVQQLARQGQADQLAFQDCLASLFKRDAESYADVYGGIDNLTTGLNVLKSQLGRVNQNYNVEINRYGVTLLHLEKKLSTRPDMIELIGNGLDAARAQLEFFSIDHENVIHKLADIYQQTISRLGPRIIVHGEQARLSDADTTSRIRALLLAGIRAAVLWRQAGGSRWRLLMGRQAIMRETNALLA